MNLLQAFCVWSMFAGATLYVLLAGGDFRRGDWKSRTGIVALWPVATVLSPLAVLGAMVFIFCLIWDN